MSKQDFLVTIHVPAILEEAVIDCLLALELADGFSSLAVNGHVCEHQGLSIAEKVAGRKKQIRFQMNVREQQLNALIVKLKQCFPGSGMHYWVVPVLESGTL